MQANFIRMVAKPSEANTSFRVGRKETLELARIPDDDRCGGHAKRRKNLSFGGGPRWQREFEQTDSSAAGRGIPGFEVSVRKLHFGIGQLDDLSGIALFVRFADRRFADLI